jgi:hypothetical protein
LRRIHFAMRSYHGIMPVGFSATFAQIIDQLFARFQLAACRLIAIKIADETNPERDVVKIIAVDVTTVDLSPPTIADLDFAVASGGAVADHEMVVESVLHSADVPMIVVENTGIALPGAAIVHDNELPAPPHNGRAINFGAN